MGTVGDGASSAGSAVGDTEVAFGLVEESVAWFADAPGGGPADGPVRHRVGALGRRRRRHRELGKVGGQSD